MPYPNVTDAMVRDEIAHITTQIVSTTLLETMIVNAKNWFESKIAGEADLAEIRALSTTPTVIQEAIKAKSRSLALIKAYGESTSGDRADVRYWVHLAENVVKAILSGERKVLKADDTVLAIGGAFHTPDSSKRELNAGEGPYFGYGDRGKWDDDINTRTVY